MRIDNKSLNKLINDLKRLRSDLLRQSSEIIIDLSKSLNESYTHSIDELVYDEYSPMSYERTMHLRGAHGAKVEVMKLVGEEKSYSFYIDENSVDPIDGSTWKEKADKIEHGATEMTVGFNRPFIQETQHSLEWETNRLVHALIKGYERTIKKVGG